MTAREAITVVILTLNEERHIRACIRSARELTSNILVLDSYSTDRTVELARSEGAMVLQRTFDTYPGQRNAALRAVSTPWVFFLDADERIPVDLAAEIREAIRKEDKVGWWVPRRNIIVGKWIRGGGWYPDYQLRLMRVDRAHYDPQREVHEVVLLDGDAGYLSHPLVHYNYDTWTEFRAKQHRYADYEVRVLQQQGVTTRPYTPYTMPVREFWRRFVQLRGFKDGGHGLRLALYMALYTHHVYRALREQEQKR